MLKEKATVLAALSVVLITVVTLFIKTVNKRAKIHNRVIGRGLRNNLEPDRLYKDIYDRRSKDRTIGSVWLKFNMRLAEKRLSMAMLNYITDGSLVAKRDMVKQYNRIHELRVIQLHRQVSSKRLVTHIDTDVLKNIMENDDYISTLDDGDVKYSKIIDILKKTDEQLTNKR